MKALQDSTGKPSSMRAAMMLCVGTGCTLALLGTTMCIQAKTPIDPQLTWLVGTLLTVGFGGKVAQKFRE